MSGNTIMRAKRNRAGTFGQSSRMYTLNRFDTSKKIPGGQGVGFHNPSIGSMLSLTRRVVKDMK